MEKISSVCLETHFHFINSKCAHREVLRGFSSFESNGDRITWWEEEKKDLDEIRCVMVMSGTPEEGVSYS